MRLYLHIGSHKTGTTALQRFAALNRGFLRDHGLLYPELAPWGTDAPNQMPVIGGMFGLNGTNDLSAEQIEEFLATTRSAAQDHGYEVLLSAENVFRLTHGQRGQLYSKLRSALPGFDIAVVAALRRQDNLADSLYRTVVRSQLNPKRRPPEWLEFLESRSNLFDYWSIVSQARTCLGSQPILIPYAERERREIIPAFFAALGVDVSGAQQLARRINVSYDYIDCRVKLMLHDLKMTDEIFHHYDRYAGMNPVHTPYSFFSEAERRDFLASYAEGNAALCAEYPELAAAIGEDVDPDYDVEPLDEADRDVEQRFSDFNRHLSTAAAPTARPRSGTAKAPLLRRARKSLARRLLARR